MHEKELFHKNKIKLTDQRKEVYNILSRAIQPLSLDEIQHECYKIDFSSVYRSIRTFIQKGIVTEHYFGDRKPKYSLKMNDSHRHYIKCSKCGRIDELKNVCIIDEVNKKTKYKIVDHYMEFIGVCPDCLKK